MTEHDRPANNTRRTGTWMYIGMWVLVLVLLTQIFNYWLEGQHNPNRQPTATLAADGSREVALQRNRHGHYLASGRINGQPVTFMLDTGASDVSIPAAVADRLGLSRGAAQRYRTANGIVTAYLTRLERIELGSIALEDVRASINPHMDGEQILLGMSFLRQLEFTQRGDTLTLRQY